MKFSGRDALNLSRNPDTSLSGFLIFGADAGQVAESRRAVVSGLMGGENDDLRLTRLEAGQARRDPALISDSLRAQGFFGGRPIVLIEGGTDGLSKPISDALEGLSPEDGVLVVTSDALPGRSSLRKLFEGGRNLASLQLFAEAPDPSDIKSLLRAKGLHGGLTEEAAQALATTGAAMDHGSFNQLLELISLYGAEKSDPLEEADIAKLVPAGLEAELDELVTAVASGRPEKIGKLIRRLEASGTGAVSALIGLQRHFRQLLAAASNPAGAESGLAALRPPVWGPRRSAMSAQLRNWGAQRLEQANRVLFDTDAKLRSAQKAPEMAVLERCALRLAIMGRR